MAVTRANPCFSVVIPAHNEAEVIERCLRSLLAGAPPGEPEILVVCNGCTDDTAARARRFGPPVRIIDLERGSKPLALNTGNLAASALPRFFVDADVVVTYASLAAVAAELSGDAARAGAPALAVDLSHATSGVKRFFDIWMRLPYVRRGLVGAGVYGLSAAGLARLKEFPDIIGDDLYVIRLFKADERVSVAATPEGAPARFTIFPPRTLKDLIRVEVRRRAGDEEMIEFFGARAERTPGQYGALAALFAQPALWPALCVYLYVKVCSRLAYAQHRKRGTHKIWERDLSSRVASDSRGT